MVPRGGWLAQALARVLLGRDEIRPSGAQEPCHPSNLPCCSTPEATVIVGRALYATGGCSRGSSRGPTSYARETIAVSITRCGASLCIAMVATRRFAGTSSTCMRRPHPYRRIQLNSAVSVRL